MIHIRTDKEEFKSILSDDQKVSDENITLYKYMDFYKFLSFVLNRKIYFPLLNQLEDSFEGDLQTFRLVPGINNIFKGKDIGQKFRCLSLSGSAGECDLMWRAYCLNGGFRVEIDMSEFAKSAIDVDAFLAKVKYEKLSVFRRGGKKRVLKTIHPVFCPMAGKIGAYKSEMEYRLLSGVKGVRIKESIDCQDERDISRFEDCSFIEFSNLKFIKAVMACPRLSILQRQIMESDRINEHLRGEIDENFHFESSRIKLR